ncbi:MAG TPA: SRPBCC family protein [Mycobacterium sp.]|jgi:uncharacterized protein YndB with AHSA1/START domain
MTNEQISSAKTVNAPVETVFRILADPSTHGAIDGTGWVRESLDDGHLTHAGQLFRMAMYHDNHPDGRYEMENRVRDFEAPRVISWEPGQRQAPEGKLEFGGWVWRYDLTPSHENQTEVTLTYDWSAVPSETREHIPFPPFPPEHLSNSLQHLDEIARAEVS